MNSFFVFFQWFELCFQASFLVAKRIHFWSSFSHSGLFLDPFLAHVWFIFRLFWLIFRSWAHFGGAGSQFFITKTVWTTKGAPIGISPKMASLFRTHFGVIFRVFFDFWGSVFEFRFLLSPGTDFSWIWASFRHNFLIFFSTCRHLWF